MSRKFKAERESENTIYQKTTTQHNQPMEWRKIENSGSQKERDKADKESIGSALKSRQSNTIKQDH